MRRRTWFWRIGACGAVLALLAACGDDEPGAAGPSPSPSPTSTAFEEPEWTITTPAGWTREDWTANADAKKAVRYKDGDGNYFIVAIDPTGSDFNPDETWRYAVKGSGFEVVTKEDCKGSPDLPCPTADARYEVYLVSPSGADPPKVGGHAWYFIFGNLNRATTDPAVFEQIAESIRVKG